MPTLKQLLAQHETLLVPGVYDALSARIATQAGSRTIYMSGFSVAGTLLGKPDIGLATATEMIDCARRIVDSASDTPVIADGDNGYGGEHNVARLVHAYEQVGVQCIQLEDQVSPKRCGHMENKEVVSMELATSKIRAAVSARNSDEFLVMARTDARATHDLAEALRRSESFLASGADILFIEAPRSIDEMREIKSAFPDVPLVANMVEEGKTPEINVATLAELGFSIVLRPVSMLLAVSRVLQACAADLVSDGALAPGRDRLTFPDFNKMIGLDDYL